MSNQSTMSRMAQHKDHRGEAVQVGPFTIMLGGTMYLQPEDLREADVLIPLTETGLTFGQVYQVTGPASLPKMPKLEKGREYCILAAPLVDFGSVPTNWEGFLREDVIPLLAEGKKVLAFCAGSHGRTGTLLASLIALLEPDTADPIAAARQRHCKAAVETEAQARAVFALRAEELPEHYHRRLHC